MPLSILLFPLLALGLSTVALLVPGLFIPAKDLIVPLLAVIMFGMGTTLTAQDFLRVVQRPAAVGLGMLLQYGIMPLAAWAISRALQLPGEILVGMVLVGASAGGTASNVICYLARGNVALSISLTLCSTLLAVLAMPYLTLLYAGQHVPVPVKDMFMSILVIIVAPVCIGVVLNSLFGKFIGRLRPALPWLSMAAIIFIIAIIVALNRDRLVNIGILVSAAVILHNSIGLLSGYLLPRLLGFDKTTSRTLAIEVGMQNSGLSVALAVKYFSAAAALPGALFSIWHNLSGSVLAGYWARKE